MAPLERRYRRWMEVFPAEYRARREDEIVAVLLDGARPDQQRPRLPEILDLVRAGAVARATGFRGSSRQRAWGDAGSIIGMLIALALAAQGAVFVSYMSRLLVSEWARSSWDSRGSSLIGWQVPVAWLLVVVLLIVGWTRPAMVVAWAAVAVRVVVTVELMAVGNTYQASHTMPQLAAAIIAAVLLSRPRRVREVVLRFGRGRLALGAVVLAAAHGLRTMRYGDVTVYLLGALATLVAVAAWAAARRRPIRPVLVDPVTRRVVIGLVAIAPVYLVSDDRPRAPWFGVAPASLVTDVIVCLALAGAGFLAAAAVPGLARRLPVRIERVQRARR